VAIRAAFHPVDLGAKVRADRANPLTSIGAVVADASNLIAFRRGGSLDAQVKGAFPSYANYVFGVYMSAAGYSLSFTLSSADKYGHLASSYKDYVQKDATYTHIPQSNVANITYGYNSQHTGTLCSKN
jgi:hypothetical protein